MNGHDMFEVSIASMDKEIEEISRSIRRNIVFLGVVIALGIFALIAEAIHTLG